MGLNMPAKTVVFTSVKKWDGDTNRYIGSGEYIQVNLLIYEMLVRHTFIHVKFTEGIDIRPSYINFTFTAFLDEWKSWPTWQGFTWHLCYNDR